MKQLQEYITEQKFGYTLENAFICAIKALMFSKDNDVICKQIIKKWFDDEDTARGLRMFLFRLGYDPKSDSPEDLFDAIVKLPMDDKYNLGK